MNRIPDNDMCKKHVRDLFQDASFHAYTQEFLNNQQAKQMYQDTAMIESN